ncbi:MAG: alanine--tRNA ligase [Deltaproteobacteria bacterium]|nr:alanine--tRNA ligase [Deltaproteobacteria bacterium]
MRARDIRQRFLDYFAGEGHTVVQSGPLIPVGDPTLFFTNAGMVPFKNVFLGAEERPYRRAASAQKCLRVQGKHNDLEEVGRTPRHHTLFEMLGNFSFGEYFKKEAIAFAWELLTREFHLPKDRLVATIFRDDDEAATLWETHLPRERIFRFDEADNFWAMGETGPCGPCSELHYDWAPKRGVPTIADVASDRFWEVWNLVFMQYNRTREGALTPLTKPSIDTGMGLERLAAILQGKASNYDTDLFTPLLTAVERIARVSYGAGAESDISMRVLADHIRATAFLIAEGVLPSNEGRGYVLRRIMRRAIRHGKRLGMDAPFFHQLVPVLVDEMGMAYPELARHEQMIAQVVAAEETRFFETLEKGLAILQDRFAALRTRGETTLPGDIVFQLYDTYGFPKDLTEDIAAEEQLRVDHDGFAKCMEAQRTLARSASKIGGVEKTLPVYEEMAAEGLRGVFTGYTAESGTATVVALVREGVRVTHADAGEVVEVLVDQTPFYAEAGGQVGDIGTIRAEGVHATVQETQRPLPGLILHRATVTHGRLTVGARATLAIDADRRDQIRKHHSATHLLHKALREALGDHVRQAGSLVAPDRLRFDFSHFAVVTPAQIREIEADVNRVIQANLPVTTVERPREEAIAAGAMAFFGEKYGATVRVVTMGQYSMELCGGTHVRATGEIGALKIVGESSVAAGMRRVEALCGRAVVQYLQTLEREQGVLAGLLKVGPAEVRGRVERLMEQMRTLERDVRAARVKAASDEDLLASATQVEGITVVAGVVHGIDHKALREVGDRYRQRVTSGIVALGTIHGDRAHVIVMVTADLTRRFSAHALLQPVVAALEGKGGGRADFAQGGGPKVDALETALATLPNHLGTSYAS